MTTTETILSYLEADESMIGSPAAEIAKYTGIDRKTVDRELRKLVKADKVRVYKQRAINTGRPINGRRNPVQPAMNFYR